METSATAGEVKQQVKHLGLGQQGSYWTMEETQLYGQDNVEAALAL